ncbi:MAG: transporter substrate-binding domain-containing protein [Pseudomonadota bacterium]
MSLRNLTGIGKSALASVLTAACFLTLGAQPVSAQGVGPIECGTAYQVVKGDTLNSIAVRAYKVGNHRVIQRANRSQLPNGNIIEIDQRLLVPCLDGSGPQTVEEYVARGGVIEAPETELALTQPQRLAAPVAKGRIKFLTGSDYAPFTDEDMPEGGMITELVKRAMKHADERQDYRVTFVNDWGPHLSILLPEGAFDMGFPWFKPDCSKIALLSEGMQSRCRDFIFSDPFFEVNIGYYVNKASPLAAAKTYGDLAGKVICRPRGYFTFDLEQEGLSEPNIIMLTLPTPEGCFKALRDGVADVVSLNTWLAEEELANLNTKDQTVELNDLGTVQTLHVITPKTNANGPSYVTLVNKGLSEMKQSGEWFEVVSRQLTAQGQKLQ